VQSGAVTEATITNAARRVLLEMDRFGYLDGKTGHTILSPSTEAGEHVSAEDAEVVRKTGEDAAVLLKNESNILPLSSHALRSVALIGPGALQTIAVGQPGEKSVGLPGEEIGPLEALRKLTHTEPNVHLTYAVADDMSGVPIPAANLSHEGKPGLEREAEGGEPAQTDAQIDFTVRNGHALAANGSYRWSGTLTVPSSGRYEIHMQILGAYGTLMLDGKRVAGNGKMWVHGDVTQAGQNNLLPTNDGLDNVSADAELSAGPHKLTLTVVPDTSGNPVQVRLNWVTPDEQASNYKHALDTAKQAGTVVVFAWAQGDPKFHLSREQDRLIEAIAMLNANVIVVLNTSQPVALPWLDHVKGVVEMWWPGDEGGWATADVLLGRANPAGRLPFTWGRRVEDYPATDPAHPERRGDNPDGKGIFSEGIFVGYRWFDKQSIEPLFPFGFGMSYTHFEYAGLRTRAAADGGVEVSFTVRNAGRVAGDEVPQVYLGPPPNGPEEVQFAVRALAAFDRVHLQPQQSRTVTLHVPIRSFQFWSASEGRWMKAQGARTISVGRSSRDLALETTIR
jgi:beta-glucosidase